MRHQVSVALLVSLAAVTSCRSTAAPPPPAPGGAVWFDTLGHHHRAVTTTSADAQRWFDQGLTWLYAFNHDEAERAFREAARLDPSCAMAWWGVTLANGPHINKPGV